MQSLAAGTGDRFAAGGVRQTIIELEHGIFFLIAAGQGSCLAALCPPEADAGTVAYEMAMLAKRARPHLAALPGCGRPSSRRSDRVTADDAWPHRESGPVVRPTQ